MGGIANLLCRGIDVVRNKIKMFAQKKVTLPPGRHKIVLLDEADRCGIWKEIEFW
jgi:DNA polymerase III delta prime subunit